MKIDPYKLRPVPPRIGLLLDERTALVEGGWTVALEKVPPDVRVFSSGDLVSELLADEKGEALAWNGEPIRWRPARGNTWKNDASDVRVFWLPFPSPVRALEGLVFWRDWLADYGAGPLGSLGGSAFSLLRATLKEPLWTTVGEHPPIRFTLGGRQEVGRSGPGYYMGDLYHFDIPAAYAEVLGSLRYGGWWREVDPAFPFELAHARGMLTFVRARIRVPDLPYGPLPRRPRSQPGLWEGVLFPVSYPTETRLQGVWTWDELRSAIEAGCTLEKVLTVWIHQTGDETHLPFAPWWRAVQEGRSMPDFASTLAKATGNALWGQFCIRPDGRRDVIRWRRKKGTMVRELHRVPVYGTRPGAPDLAELVTGKVRARLAAFMLAAGDRLLAAHTDGAWTRKLPRRPKGWRLDARAYRLDLLGPQELRYWPPGERDPVYVVSGVPEKLAPETFERAWAEHGRELDGPEHRGDDLCRCFVA